MRFNDTGIVGVIVVDHGSRMAAANDMLHAVVELFKRVSGRKIVEAAHMELAEPTIAQAFAACAAAGATRVVIHPYFLSPGRHSTTDIPRMAAEAAAAFRGISYHVTEPLGLDEKLANVMEQRIAQCQANYYSCDSCACRQGARPNIVAAIAATEPCAAGVEPPLRS